MQYNFADPTVPRYRWLSTPAGGKTDLKPICDTHSFEWLDPNPDGTGFLGVGWKHNAKEITPHAVYAVADGKATEVAKIEWPGTLTWVRWSPDGQRFARMIYWPVKDGKTLDEFVLSVLSADGKTEEKLHTWHDKWMSRELVGWFPTK